MQGFGASGGRPSAGLTFPPGFLWGTATSAHQVEGDNTKNDWWAWEHQAGRIAQGHRSGRACDWWRAVHHFTFPLWVARRGGWLTRRSAEPAA